MLVQQQALLSTCLEEGFSFRKKDEGLLISALWFFTSFLLLLKNIPVQILCQPFFQVLKIFVIYSKRRAFSSAGNGTFGVTLLNVL